jgi:A/G-specific adenine glycosylase
MGSKKIVKSIAILKEAHPFVGELLHWNRNDNFREMPWKGEKDPYRIWLSEIILQQTRVEQGWKYYEAFIHAFPAIKDLAAAPEQQVFKLWEGLGYYTRCRNLIATAKFITDQKEGIFPDAYEEILKLKGVGPYTAAAIASFAYNLPHAVVDGNVFRVLSRIYSIETPIDSTQGKQEFIQLANEMLPVDQAGIYNQAIMDFGASVCKPIPICESCFYQEKCFAYMQKKQALLPVKAKKPGKRMRWFHYIVIEHGDELLIHQRKVKDIWQDLFEPLLIEAKDQLNKQEIVKQLQITYQINPADYEIISAAATATQKLTHQTIHFSFLHLQCHTKPEIKGFIWVKQQQLNEYPLPKTILSFLLKNSF